MAENLVIVVCETSERSVDMKIFFEDIPKFCESKK